MNNYGQNLQSIKKNYSILDIASRLGIIVNEKNFARCINHKPDNNPSLSFNLQENYCKCFSCDYHADTIKLVQDVLKCSFGEAINFITNDYSKNYQYAKIDFTKNKKRYTSKDRAVNSKHQDIFKSFILMLDNFDAIKYLNKRNISVNVLEYHQIKSLPSGAQNQKNIIDKLTLEYGLEDLIDAGIVSQRGYFTHAFHRLIIPYFDLNGNILSIQGRDIDNSSNSKYLFNKNAIRSLYNLENILGWKHGSDIIICEGVIDCLTFERLGFKCIAVPGVQSINLFDAVDFSNYNIVVFGDNDRAGHNFNFEVFKYFYHQYNMQISQFNISTLADKLNVDIKNIADINALITLVEIYQLGESEFIKTRDGVLILDKGDYLEMDNSSFKKYLIQEKTNSSIGEYLKL